MAHPLTVDELVRSPALQLSVIAGEGVWGGGSGGPT